MGINYLEVIFMLFWMKYTLICFKLQRNETGNRLSNIKDIFTERFQLQMLALHQSMLKVGLPQGWSLRFKICVGRKQTQVGRA